MSKITDRVTASVRAVMPLALALLSSLAGCTALIDISKSQCSTDGDCESLFSEAPFLCVNSVCERPFCERDSDCRDRGGRFATSSCSPVEKRCVPPECTTAEDCGSGGACQPSTNRCVPRECTITQDCLAIDDGSRASTTITCDQGFCRDDVWGCIGQPDDRPRLPGETGTLRVPLYNPLTNAPLVGSEWTARVCPPPVDDPNCLQPLDLPSSYDAETGIVTVEQLASDRPVRLWLTETKLVDTTRLNQKASVDMEFITQKPPVGVVTTPALRIVTWEWIATLIKSYVQEGTLDGDDAAISSVFKLGTQTIFGDAFDCQDNRAANVHVKFKDDTGQDFTDYLTYFWDAQNLAFTPPTHNATFGTGVWSTANLPVERTWLLRSNLMVDSSHTKSRIIRADYPIVLSNLRMMTIHLYPRGYADASAP